MQIITVDFETFYEPSYSLSVLTTEAYVRDRRFEVIGVAVKVGSGETQWCSGAKDQIALWLRGFDWENSYVLAHNTAFDGFILSEHFQLRPMAYGDTMAMGQALYGVDNRVSLANLSLLLQCGVKGDEVVKARGKRREDFTSEELNAYGQYCRNDVDLTYALFEKMVPHFPQRELKLIDLTLRMSIYPKLGLDMVRLSNYHYALLTKKAELLSKCNVSKAELMSNPKFAEALKGIGIDPPTKISPTTKKTTWAFAKTDEGFKALLNHEREDVQALAAARLGNKSTLAETRALSFMGIAHRGTYPFTVKYAGAAITHRWSGFDLNPQNLPRGSELRKSILAPKGHVIVVADLKAIELRVGFWLAGELAELETLRQGIDTYRKSAEEIEGTPYDQVGADLRFVFKTVNLSGIFGVGPKKMQASLKSGSGGPVVDKPLEEIEAVVEKFRRRHPYLTAAWKQGENFLWALDRGQYIQGFRDGVIETVDGGLRKPSGMILKYPGLKRLFDAKENKYQWIFYRLHKYAKAIPDKVYGAKVFQRCTQSLARDILAGHMLAINRLFPVVGTVHDEVLVLAPTSAADECVAYVNECMRKPPSWGLDIPLEAEIGYDERYSK